MSTTINTYVYLDKIPLDAIFDLVTAGIKEARPQRDVRMLGSGIGGIYQFLFKGENDAQRVLTKPFMGFLCPHDKPLPLPGFGGGARRDHEGTGPAWVRM